jgi:hypothetical protein
MTTRVEELAQQRALLGDKLKPGYQLDDETRERYKNTPVMRGTAFTKSEQMNLGGAVAVHEEVQARVSSQ